LKNFRRRSGGALLLDTLARTRWCTIGCAHGILFLRRGRIPIKNTDLRENNKGIDVWSSHKENFGRRHHLVIDPGYGKFAPNFRLSNMETKTEETVSQFIGVSGWTFCSGVCDG